MCHIRRWFEIHFLGVKTMRLRVFCNYFMYTLITFTTLINIVVSPYVSVYVFLSFSFSRCMFTCYFWNMTSEKSSETTNSRCDVILWIKAHCMCCFIENVYFVSLNVRYIQYCECIMVFAISHANGWLEWTSKWDGIHKQKPPNVYHLHQNII